MPIATAFMVATGTEDRRMAKPLLPEDLWEIIPPVAGKVGRPRKKPNALLGDRAYDSERHRQGLREREAEPLLA